MTEYNSGPSVVASICASAEELTLVHMKRDPHGARTFWGSIHDITLTNAGDLNSVSIYDALSVQIAAKISRGTRTQRL